MPEPCRPTSMMVVTGWLERVREWSPPLSRDVNSSWTILTTCWPGERLSRTSEPRARSFTAATKSLATRKLTSASSRDRRTRLRASSTSPSVRRPLLDSLFRMPVNRSVRFSNMSVLVAFCATCLGATCFRRSLLVPASRCDLLSIVGSAELQGQGWQARLLPAKQPDRH